MVNKYDVVRQCQLVISIAFRVRSGGNPPANTFRGAAGYAELPPDAKDGESELGWLTPAGMMQPDDCGEDEGGVFGRCVVHTLDEAKAAWAANPSRPATDAPPAPPRYLWRAVQTARGPVLHAFLGEDARISACGTVHADRTEEARAWVGKCGSCSRLAPPSCRLRESLRAAYATEKTEPQPGIVADIERAYAAATHHRP